jgi:hypothetical protein
VDENTKDPLTAGIYTSEFLATIIGAVITAVVAWLISHGVIGEEQRATAQEILGSIGLAGVTALIGVYVHGRSKLKQAAVSGGTGTLSMKVDAKESS